MNNQHNVKNTIESNQNTVENNQNNQNHDFTVEKSFKRKTYRESKSDNDIYTVSKSEFNSDDTVSDTTVVSPWAKSGFSASRVRVKPL